MDTQRLLLLISPSEYTPSLAVMLIQGVRSFPDGQPRTRYTECKLSSLCLS